MAQVERVDLGDLGDVGRQVLRARHRRTVDQDRNHGDVLTLERCGDLLSQVVAFIVYAPLAARQSGVEPCVPDQDEYDLTGVERGVNPILEVGRERDRIHVNEDSGATKPLAEVVGQVPGRARRVVTPV